MNGLKRIERNDMGFVVSLEFYPDVLGKDVKVVLEAFKFVKPDENHQPAKELVPQTNGETPETK